MPLELSKREADLLRDLLKNRIDGLSLEIHRTDNHSYRHGLEEMQASLQAILDRLPAPQ